MARRRNNQIGVELFPFLSILACVIGVLTLAIAGMVVGQMDTDTVRKIERAQQYQQIQQTITQRASEQDRLKNLIAKANTLADKLEAARRELERWKTKKRNIDERRDQLEKQNVSILAKLDSLRREIRRLESDLNDLQADIEQTRQRLAERQKPPEPADIVIKPGGSREVDARAIERAVFAECREHAVIVYKDLEGNDTIRFSKNNLSSNLQFIKALDEIAVEKRWIVFLVRPDGWGTARAAEQLAIQRGAYNGKLPVPGQGRVDLSVFKQMIEKGS
jgi:myosin heavy subunit